MVSLLSTVSSIAFMKRYALLCFLAFWAVSAEAAIYYVRPGGSDSHSCGQAQTDNDANAKRTIQNVTDTCPSAGDSIIVHGGIYNEGVEVTASRQGTGGNPITIRNAPGETVWIYGGIGFTDHLLGGGTGPNRYWTLDGINVDARDQRSFPIWSDGDVYYLVLKNLEVTGSNGDGAIGIGGDGDTYHQILNVKVHDNNGPNSACRDPSHGGGCHGIYLHGNYNIVDGVEAYNNPFGNGLTMYGVPIAPRGNILRNSKFHHNGFNGIQVTYAPDTQIYNNLFYSQVSGASGIGVEGANNTTVYNNTIYGNSGAGLRIRDDASNTIARNNIIYNNGGNIDNGSGSTILSNNLTADPRFV